MSRRERGSALLLVLWVTVLLAALLAGLAASARSHGQAALYGSEQVRARLAAEAGIARAVAGLRAPDLGRRWVPDGRPYDFDFDGARVRVRVVDVAGLFDLNAAPTDLLQRLFATAGADPSLAADLAGAIAKRRGAAQDKPGDAGAAWQSSFHDLSELAAMPGMDGKLYARLEPAVTVFSGRNFPDADYAGPLVLAALRGVNRQAAETLVKDRRARPASADATGLVRGGAATGGPLVAGHGGTVERVFSSAVMPDGTRVDLDVTLRLALTPTNARPYKVLGWRAGAAPAP